MFYILELIALSIVILLININAFARFRQFPEVDNLSANEREYLLIAAIGLILILLILWRERLLATCTNAWLHQWPLILFLAYAALSLLWTVYIPATFYKLFFLFFATLAGSYIAVRYGLRGTLNVLTWIGGIFVILSLVIVLYLPLVGVMQRPPFVGAWNGLFWHRNHAGNIFAFFNLVFLFRFLADQVGTRSERVVLLVLYVSSAALVFGSRSATGVILFLFLHFVLGLILLWLKVHERLRVWHYYASAATLLAGFLVFITNTGFFFGLLGRSPQMTGRIPLWQDLFQNFYLERPILGYGYGALWMQKSFRIQMQIRHEWPFQVYFADNGFFDILLNLGLIGFLLFLSIYLPLGIRSLREAVNTKSWLSFFPFLTFLYILVGNLTYSFILEVDQFVWMLLVIMVFLTSAPRNNNVPQP
jgi:O-antigen ligase